MKRPNKNKVLARSAPLPKGSSVASMALCSTSIPRRSASRAATSYSILGVVWARQGRDETALGWLGEDVRET